MSTTFTVSSTAELLSALSNATGGDTVLLESGSYAGFSETYNFSELCDDQECGPGQSGAV